MFQRSGNTSILVAVCREKLKQPGDRLSYDELSAAIGQDVQKEGYYYLRSARAILEREDNLHTGTLSNQGIVYQTSEEALNTTHGVLQTVRKRSTRGVRKLERIPFTELKDQDKMRHVALSAALLATSRIATERSLKKIRAAANGKPIAFANTLRLFVDYKQQGEQSTNVPTG